MLAEGLLPQTDSVRMCGKMVLILQRIPTGAFRSAPRFCDSWVCPKCGPRRAEQVCVSVASRIVDNKGAWCAVCRVLDHDDVACLMDRIKERRHRKNAGYVSIRRGLNTEPQVILLSSHELAGRKEPASMGWYDVDRALQLLADALVVPGVSVGGVSSGGLWRDPTSRKQRDRLVASDLSANFEAAMAYLNLIPDHALDKGRDADEVAEQLRQVLASRPWEG